VQLRHLRDQSKQLGSELCDMQHGMICEEQDLNVLCTRLQQMNPDDPQYVCLSATSINCYHYISTILVFILISLL